MFDIDTENKIVDFIKKSPLGVTSNDIARYLGLNRMTMTKYLAIIKEKALIDFKQFGMAKLWYIPVNLTKESFFSKIMSNIAIKMPENEFKELSEKVGISLGEGINQMYLKFNGAEKLSIDQISNAYEDIGKKLNGGFKAKLGNDKISVEILQNPFEQSNVKAMNRILSAVFAKIAALNLGYARAVVSEQEGSNTVIDVYLKKVESNLSA
ncbi:hypothetical protein HYW19_01305 [Candidatus Woesearchaeota archaeon]|nr:hypothetical protein [Candidatus Woesearchaeota archaeon]